MLHTGTIPSTIRNLKNIKLFHAHGNELGGDADFFEHDLESFIVDCGSTDKSKRLVQCDSCTQCCNEEGDCITLAKTWPNDSWKKVNIFGFILVKCLCQTHCKFNKGQHRTRIYYPVTYSSMLGHDVFCILCNFISKSEAAIN